MTWWKRLLVMVLAAVLLISAVWWGSGRIIPAMRRLSVSQEVRLPVLMYHGVHSNPKKAGDYVITPQALEEDLLYLQRQGCTTVVMSDLIAYVQQGTPLPEKPVMITFDDGYYNNYLNAYPLLQKYQMKAVISIIVGETDKYSELDENKENYSHITWDMINEMMESGLIEIQNHTYNLHKTGNPRRGAALEARYLYLSVWLLQPPQPGTAGAAWLCRFPRCGGQALLPYPGSRLSHPHSALYPHQPKNCRGAALPFLGLSRGRAAAPPSLCTGLSHPARAYPPGFPPLEKPSFWCII